MTINAEPSVFRTHIVDRAAGKVDWAAVERQQREKAAHARSERIAALHHIVFRNAPRGNRAVEGLTNETAAARLLISASNNADSFLVLAIVQVAIKKRWAEVIRACIRHFEEHPVAARIQELWDLTTDRTAV